MKRQIVVILLVISSFCAKAQNVSVSTNLVDWANFATTNLEVGVSVSQHISFVAGGKYNPWDFSNADEQMYSKSMAGYLGMRYWAWYVNSGLWFQLKGQYADYSITGTWRPALDEGRAAGGGFACGYTFMLSDHFNIELASGIWGGYLLEHNVYECTDCLRLRENDSGPRPFFDLDNLAVSLVYIF